MRNLLTLLALLVVCPVYGQTTFKASQAAMALENRVTNLERYHNEFASQTSSRLAAIETQLAGLTAQKATYLPSPQKQAVASTPVVSNRYSTAELRSLIQQARPGGWRGPVYADVAPRSMAKQHLVGSEHGFTWDQVSGLTQEEALILHDLAPNHGNKIFPQRSRSATVAYSTPVVTTQRSWERTYYSQPSLHTGTALRSDFNTGCANGQCAKSSQPMRLGWFRRR